MQPIHDRMPVILGKEDVAAWIALTTNREGAADAQALFFDEDDDLPCEQPKQQCPP